MGGLKKQALDLVRCTTSGRRDRNVDYTSTAINHLVSIGQLIRRVFHLKIMITNIRLRDKGFKLCQLWEWQLLLWYSMLVLGKGISARTPFTTFLTHCRPKIKFLNKLLLFLISTHLSNGL
jgi:hypothetical protein